MWILPRQVRGIGHPAFENKFYTDETNVYVVDYSPDLYE
jgi:hypothetical protein